MKRVSFSSLRIRLLILVLLASIPAMLLTVNNAVENRSAATARIQAETVQLTQLTAANQEQWIESTRQLLVSLAHVQSVRNRHSAACDQFFADVLEHYPQYANILAYSPDGDLICSAVPIKNKVNISGTAWFKNAVSGKDFAIGDYQAAEQISGAPVIVAAYPIYDENGILQAVVSAPLDLAWLNKEVAKMQLSPGATFRIIDQKGTIIARNPDPQIWVGQSLPEAGIIKTTLTRHEGTAEAQGVDGVMRFFAFAPIHSGMTETGLFVSNGIPASVAVGQVYNILIRDLTRLSLAILLMLVIAWFVSDVFVLRHVDALVSATERLGIGDLSVRTGVSYDLGEIGKLARAFDEMVGSLKERETQRKKAEDALKKSEEKFKTVADFAYEWEYWIDPQQKLVYISPSAQRISGYRLEDFFSDDGLLYRIVHPDDKALYQQHVSRHHDRDVPGDVDDIEFRIITRNGDVHWIQHVCCAVHDVEKHFLGRRASNRDITQRKLAEDELKKHHEHLEELVKERTEELNKKNEELERFNKLLVGRELRMIELKKHIEELNKMIGSPENTKNALSGGAKIENE